MSYAKLEARIRVGALQDARRRAQELRGWLAEATQPTAEMERELRYLERMAAAAPPTDDISRFVLELRQQYTEMVTCKAAEADLAPTRSSSSRKTTQATPKAQDVDIVAPVASFLRLRESPEQNEDEVRLLSAEGCLGQELQRYPILSVPGTESLLVFRRVKSWTEEDDEECQARQRLAVLELSKAAANLREMQDFVEQHIVADQAQIDAVEQHVADARRCTAEAVVTLASARTENEKLLAWLAPSLGLVILGAGVASVAPAAAAGCVACVLVRSGVTVGVLGFHIAGSYQLKKWQERALQAMTEQLPRAFEKFPSVEALLLQKAGLEAQRRLVAKLRDKGSWSQFHVSAQAIWKGFTIFSRPSDVRKGGRAWSTSFTTKRIAAREAFQLVRELSISGSLDPNCEVTWSRPVDEEEKTLLRYLIFSNVLFGARDFYCICRSAQEEEEEPLSFTEGQASHSVRPEAPLKERFSFAVASLEPNMDIISSTGLPDANKGMEHGAIHVSGITVADNGIGGVHVEVMADVDCNVPQILPAWASDNVVRLHVLKTAERLSHKLKKRRAPKEGATPAPVPSAGG